MAATAGCTKHRSVVLGGLLLHCRALANGEYVVWSRRVLAAAGALIAFHPVTMAAHYGLPYRKQRPRRKDGDFQYAPVGEIVTFGVSVAFAALCVVNQGMMNTTMPDNPVGGGDIYGRSVAHP